MSWLEKLGLIIFIFGIYGLLETRTYLRFSKEPGCLIILFCQTCIAVGLMLFIGIIK